MERTLIMGFVGLGGALADKEAIIPAVGSVAHVCLRITWSSLAFAVN